MFSAGSSEIDLVRSGLEDMMTEAYENMSEIWNMNNYPSLRTTAYIYSIQKLVNSHKSIESREIGAPGRIRTPDQ